MFAQISEMVKDVAVPIIAVVLILHELKPFVLKKSEGCINCAFGKGDKSKLEDLHSWHAPDQETNKFKWYDRSSEFVYALKDITKCLEKQTKCLESQTTLIREFLRKVG